LKSLGPLSLTLAIIGLFCGAGPLGLAAVILAIISLSNSTSVVSSVCGLVIGVAELLIFALCFTT
jgi:hypothetical protein